MNTQNEFRAGKTLAQSTEYHGVIAERYWFPHLDIHLYRLKLSAPGMELWMTQSELAHAIFAMLEVWKIREFPDRRGLDGEVALADCTPSVRSGGEAA